MLNPFWNSCKTELPHLRLWTQSSHDVSLYLSHQYLQLMSQPGVLPSSQPGSPLQNKMRWSMVPKARKSFKCRAALRSHKPLQILPWAARSIFQVWSCHPSLPSTDSSPKPNPVHTVVSRSSWIRPWGQHSCALDVRCSQDCRALAQWHLHSQCLRSVLSTEQPLSAVDEKHFSGRIQGQQHQLSHIKLTCKRCMRAPSAVRNFVNSSHLFECV